MLQWHVLYTKWNKEDWVVQTLAEYNIETYLPMIKILMPGQDNRLEPLFPCYLFAKINLNETHDNLTNWLPGLRSLVTMGDQPVVVSETLISLLRENCDKSSLPGQPTMPRFEPGELIQIVSGPLQGIKAIFAGPTSQEERVEILLEILGGLNRVKVNRDTLRKVRRTVKTEPQKPFKLPRRTRGRGRSINARQPAATSH